ncbi:MAG TPA: hypothetical protein VMZ69_09155, partial [Saprospiraceae bacterium]|nr:hypothetical protein [Saprospiraceae bacterium]
MKLKFITLSALSLFSTFCWSQTLLYNDGATIKIQTGAVLYVEGGVTNTATGTIDNDGILEIKGDFSNLGIWEPTTPNTLKFSGNIVSNVTSSPTVVYQDVVVAKTGANVVLASDMTVNDSLVFSASGTGLLDLATFDLTLGATAKSGGYDTDEYVRTGTTTSEMKKIYSSTGSFEYPVGFSTAPTPTFNPATLNVTAGPGDTYSVRVGASPTDGNGLGGTPLTSDVVDAVWDVKETTVGGNTYDLTLGWQESDELIGFDDLLNTVSRNDGATGWDGLFASLGPEVSNTRTRTGLTGFGAFAVGDKTVANDLVISGKVFLQGAYSAGLMSDLLRTGGWIPTVEPYTATPYSYAQVGYGGGESVSSTAVFDQTGTNDDIVDWIVIEVRDATTPATKLATRTALIQRDGDIVDLDALSPVKVKGLSDGTYHVGLRHRNHLTVRTQNALALNNTATPLNFTVAGIAYDNGSTNNEPMADLGAGVMGMWGGDADLSNHVSYNTGDRVAILNKVGLTTPSVLVNGYWREDVTMNGIVGYNTGDRVL